MCRRSRAVRDPACSNNSLYIWCVCVDVLPGPSSHPPRTGGNASQRDAALRQLHTGMAARELDRIGSMQRFICDAFDTQGGQLARRGANSGGAALAWPHAHLPTVLTAPCPFTSPPPAPHLYCKDLHKTRVELIYTRRVPTDGTTALLATLANCMACIAGLTTYVGGQYTAVPLVGAALVLPLVQAGCVAAAPVPPSPSVHTLCARTGAGAGGRRGAGPAVLRYPPADPSDRPADPARAAAGRWVCMLCGLPQCSCWVPPTRPPAHHTPRPPSGPLLRCTSLALHVAGVIHLLEHGLAHPCTGEDDGTGHCCLPPRLISAAAMVSAIALVELHAKCAGGAGGWRRQSGVAGVHQALPATLATPATPPAPPQAGDVSARRHAAGRPPHVPRALRPGEEATQVGEDNRAIRLHPHAATPPRPRCLAVHCRW